MKKQRKRKMFIPRGDSFTYRTIVCLLFNGETSVKNIRKFIGLNEHAKKSHYPDRSSYYFSNNISSKLLERGVIIKTKYGHYDLVKEYKKFFTKHFNI